MPAADFQTPPAPAPAGAAAATPAAAPDREDHAAPVCCPLCDYDLRGLAEPRCPECGYRFAWPDLIDPSRRRHPYLFEHHPRHNTWSFARTFAGGLRPGRFWSSLKPSQPSRPGRLVLYWLVASLLLPLGYAAAFARTAVAYVPEHNRQRLAHLGWAARTVKAGNNTWVPDIARAGGPQAWVDLRLPPPGSPAYARHLYELKYAPSVRKHVQIVALYVAWPWVTLAALMIFRASMRRAKVRTEHVVRCALYTCDAAPWLAVAVAVAVPPLVERFDLGRRIGYQDVAVAAPLFALATTWRLSAAYRHYLRFDRSLATTASAQLVVLLAVWLFLYT